MVEGVVTVDVEVDSVVDEVATEAAAVELEETAEAAIAVTGTEVVVVVEALVGEDKVGTETAFVGMGKAESAVVDCIEPVVDTTDAVVIDMVAAGSAEWEVLVKKGSKML